MEQAEATRQTMKSRQTKYICLDPIMISIKNLDVGIQNSNSTTAKSMLTLNVLHVKDNGNYLSIFKVLFDIFHASVLKI